MVLLCYAEVLRSEGCLIMYAILCTQNGFRAGRSCIDHIFSLVTILINRKLQNKQTFLCFIDFRRAFDSVSHVLLFHILYSQFGIVGKIYDTLSSLYSNPLT